MKPERSAREVLEMLEAGGDAPQTRQVRKERIDTALSALFELIDKRLPKELDKIFGCTGIKRDREFYKGGFNDCCTQVHSILREVLK